MTIEEALKALTEGKKVRKKTWDTGWYVKLLGERIVNKNGGCDFISIADLSEDNWEEYKEPVLDEAEKKYLSAVIKPFRNRVRTIYKEVLGGDDDNRRYCVHICLYYEGDSLYFDFIDLPRFIGNRMYKGMKDNKKYTLEELGL